MLSTVREELGAKSRDRGDRITRPTTRRIAVIEPVTNLRPTPKGWTTFPSNLIENRAATTSNASGIGPNECTREMEGSLGFTSWLLLRWGLSRRIRLGFRWRLLLGFSWSVSGGSRGGSLGLASVGRSPEC